MRVISFASDPIVSDRPCVPDSELHFVFNEESSVPFLVNYSNFICDRVVRYGEPRSGRAAGVGVAKIFDFIAEITAAHCNDRSPRDVVYCKLALDKVIIETIIARYRRHARQNFSSIVVF